MYKNVIINPTEKKHHKKQKKTILKRKQSGII